MVDEVVDFSKRNKECSIIKVHFEKANDSVSWIFFIICYEDLAFVKNGEVG